MSTALLNIGLVRRLTEFNVSTSRLALPPDWHVQVHPALHEHHPHRPLHPRVRHEDLLLRLQGGCGALSMWGMIQHDGRDSTDTDTSLFQRSPGRESNQERSWNPVHFIFQLIHLLLSLSSVVTPTTRSTWWRPSVPPSLSSSPWRASSRSLPQAGGCVVCTLLYQCGILMFKQDHFC